MLFRSTVQEYDGDLDEYRTWLSERRARQEAPATAATRTDSAQARKDRKRSEAEQRQRQQPLRRKLQELEARLDVLTKRCAEIDTELAGDVYGAANKERLKELLLEQARARTELGDIEDQWLEASEALQNAIAEAE